MNEQIYRARMRQKHDSPLNWREVRNFVPGAGEFIVYDKDDTTNSQRMKIGDGESLINDLGMIAGEVYSQKQEPLDAGDGAVWFVTEGNSEDANLGGTADVLYFSYNGHPLPYLPNWNKAEYPQAFITIIQSEVTFYVTKETLYATYHDSGEFNGVSFKYDNKGKTQYTYRKWILDKETNRWRTDGAVHSVTYQRFDNVIWTYKNIINSGVIALQATQPKPIYQYQVEKQYSDWNVSNTERVGYIANRPVWRTSDNTSVYWNPSAPQVTVGGVLNYHTSTFIPPSNFYESLSGNLDLYLASGETPYTNIAFPEVGADYDNVLFPYCIGRLSYNNNQVDWSEARFYYSNSPFFLKRNNGTMHRGQDYFSNAAESYLVIYNKESGTWSEVNKIAAFDDVFCPGESALPGGDRFISNANILDESGVIVCKAYNWSSIVYGNKQEYGGFVLTLNELDEVLTEENADSRKFFLLDGSANAEVQSSLVVEIFNIKLSEESIPIKNSLGYLCLEGHDAPGVYFSIKTGNDLHISLLNFDYSKIEVKEDFQEVFKKPHAANIKVLKPQVLKNISILQERNDNAAAAALLKNEVNSLVAIGDIIAIPTKIVNLL